MRTKKMHKKFSIFEMLVVLSILSILASLIFNTLGNARDEAKRIQCQNNLRQIQSIFEVYRMNHRELPSANNQLDFSFAEDYLEVD